MKVSTIALLLLGIASWTPPGMVGCGPFGNQDETVKVVFVQWKRGPDGITTRRLKETDLTQAEIDRLATQGVSGALNVVGYQIHGSGNNPKPRRIIIVMDHQIDERVDLRQPSDADAIYLQLGNEWKLLPAGTATNQRVVRLEVNEENKSQTRYWFQLPDGAMQGTTPFDW